MVAPKSQVFDALCNFLVARREELLLAWRKAVDTDPEQPTARSLTRGQLYDHIPEVLDAFARRLCSGPGSKEAQTADFAKIQEEVKHGSHRWQQGYQLPEVLHEWRHLQLCLFEEIEAFAAAHPDFGRDTLAEANRQMINFVNETITESATQYARMQQAEAAGRLHDLGNALTALRQIERHRTALIHQAVHDLRGNVQSITTAADVLGETSLAESERLEFAALIHQGVESVATMLGDLMELARLQAGLERAEITTFDAAVLMTELAQVNRPIASERGLFLNVEGVAHLPIESDQGKVRRLLQNLLLNALKYTVQGGVTLSWGEEKENWWFMVKDTGPGIPPESNAPMVTALKEATASARESDEKIAAGEGKTSQVLTTPPNNAATTPQPHRQPGEGIGLSIVKRLCELLDASLEMASSAETGTTFRVVFPRHFQATPKS
jgi:signal transduction histidine kinase